MTRLQSLVSTPRVVGHLHDPDLRIRDRRIGGDRDQLRRRREEGLDPRPGRLPHRLRLPAAVIATCLASLLWTLSPAAAGASLPTPTTTPNIGVLPFADDVFTIGSNGSLISVDPSATSPSAPLFNLAGSPLNLTWGQFSAATGTSQAWTDRFHGIHTDFRIQLSGLIPNGIYSLFYRTFAPDSNNAFCPNVEPTIALRSVLGLRQKPDPDSFTTSGSGTALFRGRVAGNLLAAQQLQVVVIYHYDGKTYGPVTNQAESNGPDPSNGGLCRSSYGIDAMRQLLIIQK